MFILEEATKFLGAVLATVVAIAATYLDGTKSAESGRLTKKGRILVAFAILGLLLSGGAQITQMIDSQVSAEANRRRNEETARRLERIPRLLARSNLPLEPLELLFDIEFPMDQPPLRSYAERQRGDIVRFLRDEREGRRTTSENLADEEVMFVITNKKQWIPGQTDSERPAVELLEDNTAFHFYDRENQQKTDLRFLSTSPATQEVIVTMRRHGDISQRMELSADFERRVFVKHVRCKNPVRTGSDIVAFSSLDLVGRVLRWDSGIASNLDWRLVSFGMRFSFDYGFEQNFERLPPGRTIFLAGQDSLVVTGDLLGLTDVLSRP